MSKSNYVDGFVVVAPKKNTALYKKMALDGARLWKRHGALDYKECMGDDLTPHMGGMKFLTFPKMTKVKAGETVWFSFITFKSRAHRDAVNKKVMAEMSKPSNAKYKNMKMPFDVKRMAYGGFVVMVSS